MVYDLGEKVEERGKVAHPAENYRMSHCKPL
jgi:hypothetical protein